MLRAGAFDLLDDAVVIFGDDGKIIDINKATVLLLNKAKGDIVGRTCNDVFKCERSGHHCFLNMVRYMNKDEISGEHTIIDGGGKQRRIFVTIRKLFDESGKVEALVEVIRDVDEIERINKSLLDQTMTDPLTGLWNRRRIFEALDAEAARSTRHGRAYSLLMLDIDHFKDFNDTYGHLAGDDALRFLAVIIGRNTRKEDVAARYGGEEFMLLLPETDIEGATMFAERLRETIEKQSAESKQLKNAFTVSIGVSFCDPGCSCNATSMVSEADRALYSAKRAGRNRVATFKVHCD